MYCTDSLLVVYFNKTALDSQTNAAFSNRPYSIKFAGTTIPECMIDKSSSSSNTNKDYNNIIQQPTIFASSGSVYIATNFTENMCGVNVISDEFSIIYNTTIIVTYGENPNPLIQREEYDHYNVMCVRNRTVNEKLFGKKVDVILEETEQATKSACFFFYEFFYSET